MGGWVALADDPSDWVTLKVFSDWLRDQSREADADEVQKGRHGRGDE